MNVVFWQSLGAHTYLELKATGFAQPRIDRGWKPWLRAQAITGETRKTGMQQLESNGYGIHATLA